MKKAVNMLYAITLDMWYEVKYFVLVNIRYIPVLLNVLLPYAMYMIGQDVATTRGRLSVGGEIFIPVLFTSASYYIREVANKAGKGNVVPIPVKRFTNISDDGEVTVERKRLQELLLYMADLEDYMERRGWL